MAQWLADRWNEKTTRMALVYALGHTQSLLMSPAPINWHALTSVIIGSLIIALTPEGSKP